MMSALWSSVLVLMICCTNEYEIYAAKGSNVTLHCNHTLGPDNLDDIKVTWVVWTTPYKLIIWFAKGESCDGYEAVKGRVHFTSADPRNGNASISISNLRLSDTGKYVCSVQMFKRNSNISVSLTVMEKPSKPVCAVEGEPGAGIGVTLKCRSSQGTPPLTYSWTKKRGNQMLPPDANVNTTTGDLFIDRITEENCGRYLCTVESPVATKHCKVLLECPSSPPTIRDEGPSTVSPPTMRDEGPSTVSPPTMRDEDLSALSFPGMRDEDEDTGMPLAVSVMVAVPSLSFVCAVVAIWAFYRRNQ